MSHFLLFLFTLVAAAFDLGQAGDGGNDGGWTSGGGDPLRFYFTEGREVALEALDGFKNENLTQNVAADARNFLQSNLLALKSEVEKSPFDFTVSAQSTCGLTTFERGAKITFSTENCRSISSNEEAAKMILHESVHHFGVKDESLADAIAIAVIGAYENLKVKEVPFCKSNEQSQMLERLAGIWLPDPKLTQKLGGNWSESPRGRLQFSPKKDFIKEFKGVGKCALQAGELKVENRRGQFVTPYIVVSNGGSLVVITAKNAERPGGGPRQPPARPRKRIPLRPEQRSFYFNLTRAKLPSNDILFVGDEDDTEASSAFNKQ